jgi:hypothetical protein
MPVTASGVRLGLLAIACALAPALASANGRPPMTNGIHFRPGDAESLYVATTFGLLVSPDGCQFHWLCEDNIGFDGLRVSRDGGCSFETASSMVLPSMRVCPAIARAAATPAARRARSA